MKTVLITGASGFFGRSVVEALKKTTHKAHFICLYRSKQYEINDPRFSWVETDLLDHTRHHELMAHYKPTDLIHLAWDVPPRDFWHSLKNVDWLYASISLFNAFCVNGGKKFIGAGSGTEYDWSAGVLDEQTTPLNPNTLYGECKKSLHAILQQIQKKNYEETILIWARIGYFFGPYEPQKKLISLIIDSLMNQTTLSLAAADISRPYAHVNYLGEALTHALFHQHSAIDFNLSGSKGYRIKDIVDFIAETLQQQTDRVSYGVYKSPTPESEKIIFNTDRLENVIGYKIQDTFYDDLKRMIAERKRNA